MMDSLETPSTRPYLIRALYEWCTDNGFTPFIAVQVDESVRVPMEFVKDGEIVLNVSFDATSALKLGNEFIEFKGRFGGVARDIMVPVVRVLAIYARENGQGMAFPVSPLLPVAVDRSNLATEKISPPSLTSVDVSLTDGGDGPPPTKPTGRPALTRIK
ncbi:SspB Stringent starvation protein B [Comamonadaceae bacterium]